MEEYSFVCIEEQELKRLKKIASEIKNNTQNTSYDNLIEKINRIEKKSVQQELFVYDLNGELKYFELELQRKYDEQLSKLDDFKLKCIELFRLQKEDYTRILDEQNKKIDFILNKINEGIDLDNIFSSSSLKKKETAKTLCEDLRKIVLKLNDIPNKDFYLKELNKIKYLFNQCINDYEKGFYESSMSVARLVYSNIIDFRNYFIEKEEKSYNFMNIVNTKVEYIKEKIKNNKNIVFEYDNNKFNLDISFWSNNLIDNIYNKVVNLDNFALKNNDFKIVDTINNYQNEIDNLINISKLNIINSQIRANIASKCINILIESKFNIIRYSYINNDMRNDFEIVVENLLKDKFIILIKTINNSNTTINISLIENENSKNKEIKLNDIKNLLSINGIIIDS